MSIFTKDPRFESGNDCRPIHMLLHRFFVQLLPQQPDAIVALELADLAIHNNFVRVGEPGYCPPWPKIHNIMYCRMDWEQPLKVDLVVIRQVILPRHLRGDDDVVGPSDIEESEPYCGQVWVNILRLQHRGRGEYRALPDRTMCSWTCLLGHVEECGIATRFDTEENVPTHWRGIRVSPNYVGGSLRY
jgi:hypothetical protein